MKKVLCLTSALLLAFASLTGCGVTSTDSSTGGTEESKSSESAGASDESKEETNGGSDLDETVLNVYTALEDEQVADYITSFQEAYPDVTLNITRDSTGIITAKLLAEKDNPVADVVWGLSAASLLELKSQDMLEGYAPIGVDRILDEFKDTSSDEPQWVGIDAWETAFLVNKEVLESKGITDVPTSYEDLLDSQYEGLIVMSDPGSSGTGLLTVNGILNLYGEDDGWKYLEDLDKNVATYLHSGSAPAKDTAAGEYGIGVSFGYRCIKSAADLGDNGQVVFPSEGSGWDVEANSLIKKSEGEKEIAKAFLDWAIEDDQMTKYATNYPIVATGIGDDIPDGYTKNPVDQLLDVDLQWCADNREGVLETWTEKFGARSAKE